MPATLQTPLESNLAALAKQNADIVEMLRDPAIACAEPIQFVESGQGVLAGMQGGRQLCSRHRPIDEARRLADSVDMIEHAVVVVLGFGLGYHVQRLAERLGNAGIIVVFEPDVALLRSVFERIDHAHWLAKSNVLFLTQEDDRGALGVKLHNCEAILAQGVTFLEHPASMARLGKRGTAFASLVTQHMSAAQVTMNTTLTRTVDTIHNLLLNFDHYAGGHGIADLAGAAAGCPAVLVSAGPSLQKNMHLLSRPGVRDRCVIIAVQTVLKPLLAAGIRPHFVTALDYHELSKRFYEGLTAKDVDGVTLIAEPKVHPSVLDAFPGTLRCLASPFLDKLMGSEARPMGHLPSGSTVAHLSLYVARHLRCDPIIMIGQDLGFPDGLYYASGNAVHDVWAPELNPFNTMEMMEWQRIRRFHAHLRKAIDVHGKTIYTDAQMVAYLQQFERDFHQLKKAGIEVIDATEGGVAKQQTTAMPLAEALDKYATGALPALPQPGPQTNEDTRRMAATRELVAAVRRDVAALRATSKEAAGILRRMLEHQHDARKMDRAFEKIERMKQRVEKRILAFETISHLNQVGMYKRLKADRRITMSKNLNPLERQRAEIERDLENVRWIADAAEEMITQLLDAERVLGGASSSDVLRDRGAGERRRMSAQSSEAQTGSVKTRIAALIAVDPQRSGLGLRRDLGEDFFGRSVLQRTLERLSQCRNLDEIVLIAPEGFNVDALIERKRISTELSIERCDGSPFGPEHEAIIAARRWSQTCWRGGISGMSVYDEVLAPRAMHEVMERRGITAALIVGPDWPLIDPSAQTGCDAVIARHAERPETRSIVFTQAPPGLCGCLVSAALMADLANRNRLATIGARLVYQPHLPQVDPITKPANVQIDHRVRHSLIRAAFDSPARMELMRDALRDCDSIETLSPPDIVARLEGAITRHRAELPQHLILELTPQRASAGILMKSWPKWPQRGPMHPETAAQILERFAQSPDGALSLAGMGDPLMHPQFDDILSIAKQLGISAIHVRTELRGSREVLDRLLAAEVDVISVDLHADRPDTYRTMFGEDHFKRVFENIDYVVEHRRRLTENAPAAALAVPWIVPRLQRRHETYEDLERFYERWQHVLGTALLEGAPDPSDADPLIRPIAPERVRRREALQRMLVLSDGSVPVSEVDPQEGILGHAGEEELTCLWQRLCEWREATPRAMSQPGALP